MELDNCIIFSGVLRGRFNYFCSDISPTGRGGDDDDASANDVHLCRKLKKQEMKRQEDCVTNHSKNIL